MMQTLIGAASGLVIIHFCLKGLRMLPQLWRRGLETLLIFAGLVGMVGVLALELGQVYSPTATPGEIFAVLVMLAAELVFAAWLALRVAIRMMGLTADYREHQRALQRQGRFYSKSG